MARNTIDFGIDLGTTNSEIAILDGITPRVIKNTMESDFTPSCVYIDKNGNLHVGNIAKDRIYDDPRNSFMEFKRTMGTGSSYTFERSKKKMTAEELSAEVLKSLKEDVRLATGEIVENALITVPADFKLPAIEATKKAAELAGIQYCEILQEPIAAAIAYGFQKPDENTIWMVYDFGGGTFDAAIIQMKEGGFNVVAHGGDDILGGKDIDFAIIDKYLVPHIMNETNLVDFNRSQLEKYRTVFAKLKNKVEAAKISLSKVEKSIIEISDLFARAESSIDYDLFYELSREEVVDVAIPFIVRSVDKCRQVIGEAGFKPEDIKKLILVGGPTKAPYFRDFLADKDNGLNIPLEFSVDPLTVVAQGAAISAATRKSVRKENGTILPDVFALDIQYKPIDADEEPIVGIRVTPPVGKNLIGYRLEIKGVNWASGQMKVDKGSILCTLKAESGIKNTYKIILFDPEGTAVKIDNDEFSYIIGNATASQSLTHSIGLAMADDSVVWYFNKNDSLPAKKIDVFHTTHIIRKDSTADIISIPIVEGESKKAANNTLVGKLRIKPQNARRDIPINSEIEINIEIDQNRILKTKAFIPVLDEEIPNVIDLHRYEPSIQDVKDDYDVQVARLEQIKYDINQVQLDNVSDEVNIESTANTLSEIRQKISYGKDEATELIAAQSKLNEIKEKLSKAEDILDWPKKVDEANDLIENTRTIVDKFGDNNMKLQMAEMEQEINKTINVKDSDLLTKQLSELSDFRISIVIQQPGWWVYMLSELKKEDINTFTDPAAARKNIADGNNAVTSQNLDGIRRAVVSLINLLPSGRQEKYASGYGSSLIH